MDKQNLYDAIIVGSGPAGMTAGIYTARRAMKTLIISKEIGGQMSKTVIIENHPGVKTIDGVSLAFQMQEQTKSLGVEFENESVKEIRNQKSEIKDLNNTNLFKVITESGKFFKTKSVILAFGLEKRKLGIANEEKYNGKGLSYCVTCDGPLYKGRQVVVVGGGNSGAEAVEFMAKICPKVYWLEMTDKVNAVQVLQDRIKKLDNVEIITGTKVVEIIGNDMLTGVKVKNNNQEKQLDVTGVIVEIGYIAKTDWLKDLVELNKFGQVKINNLCHTNIPGIFAAGDVTDSKYKQIVVAEGQGAIAGLEAYEYINK